MPKLTPYQRQIVERKKDTVIELYKQGIPYREIGQRVGRSHGWVMNVVKEKTVAIMPENIEDSELSTE